MTNYYTPDSVRDMFERGEETYKIIDYTIPSMDNIQSMLFFLDYVGIKDDDIDSFDDTQVILKHPDFDFKLVIDSGGFGDFYSHRYDVSLFVE